MWPLWGKRASVLQLSASSGLPHRVNRPLIYRLALIEIEAKLIPEVDSELTLANLDKCKQKPEEDLPTFHARMVYYWLRAHLMHDADVAETDRMLIRHFVKGLACSDTKKRTMDHD